MTLLEYGEREFMRGADVFVNRRDGLPSEHFNFQSWNKAMEFARTISPTICEGSSLHIQDFESAMRIANLENGRIVEGNTHSGIIELMNSEDGAGI